MSASAILSPEKTSIERSTLAGGDSGGVSNEPAKGVTLQIVLDRLQVSLTCAQLDAPVTITEDRLEVGSAWNRVDHSCPAGSQKVDEVATDVLSGSVVWERVGDRLRLSTTTPDNQTTLVFRPTQMPWANDDGGIKVEPDDGTGGGVDPGTAEQ